MFGDTDLEMSLYPDLEALSNASFRGAIEGVKVFMPNESNEGSHDKSIQCLGVCVMG